MTSAKTTREGEMEGNKEGIKEFNCNLCTISFLTNGEQRGHMKCAWHIYNLKRKIASLPAISEPIFTASAAQIEAQNKHSDMAGKEDEGFERVFECGQCGRGFSTERKLRGHVGRGCLHLGGDGDGGIVDGQTIETSMENIALGSTSTDTASNEISDLEDSEEENEEDGGVEFIESNCLFCLSGSENLDDAMEHMGKEHGFLVPDIEKLTDLPTFLSYLHLLITEFRECIFCKKEFVGTEGVRGHMRDKGHCRIDSEYEEMREFWEERGEGDGKGKGKGGVEKLGLSLGDREILAGVGASPRILRNRRAGKERRLRISKELSIVKLDTDVTTGDDNSEQVATGEIESLNRERGMVATRGKRNEMGIVGLSEGEKRALRVVEKKMMRVEIRERMRFSAARERGGNSQKHFRNDVPGPSNG